MESAKIIDRCVLNNIEVAFNSRNALDFFRICNITGFDPSNLGELYLELYQQGEFEDKVERFGLEKVIGPIGRRENFLALLDEARTFGVPIASWEEYSSTKIKLLTKYLPDRFGDGGEQDLKARAYTNGQIGFIFSRIINYAKRLEMTTKFR